MMERKKITILTAYSKLIYRAFWQKTAMAIGTGGKTDPIIILPVSPSSSSSAEPFPEL